jgi:hypothetical protein
MADVNKPDKVSAITGSVAPLYLPVPASFFLRPARPVPLLFLIDKSYYTP